MFAIVGVSVFVAMVWALWCGSVLVLATAGDYRRMVECFFDYVTWPHRHRWPLLVWSLPSALTAAIGVLSGDLAVLLIGCVVVPLGLGACVVAAVN